MSLTAIDEVHGDIQTIGIAPVLALIPLLADPNVRAGLRDAAQKGGAWAGKLLKAMNKDKDQAKGPHTESVQGVPALLVLRHPSDEPSAQLAALIREARQAQSTHPDHRRKAPRRDPRARRLTLNPSRGPRRGLRRSP